MKSDPAPSILTDDAIRKSRHRWRGLPTRVVNSKIKFLIVLPFWLLIGSCATPHTSYWATHPTLEHSTSAPMRVIEFDENGDFWDSGQVGAAQEMLRSKRKPILITYVHGWRHDASRDDSNLQGFQTFLDTLNHGLGGRVCGVYIGWRGASVDEKLGPLTTPAAVMTFWGRKEVTNSVAGVPLSVSLCGLSSLARDMKGHSIIIGHSFGGRIVERAIGQAIASQGSSNLPMPYDLAFLINPADESLYARQLKLALRNWSYSSPAIIVLAAKDDDATKHAWPLAMRLNNNLRSRDYNLGGGGTESQTSYIYTTVGNDKRQWTHELKRDHAPPLFVEQPAMQNLRYPDSRFLVRLNGKNKGKLVTCYLSESKSQAGVDHVIPSKAYWVVPLADDILSGHNGKDGGIFSPTMTDLMTGIVSSFRATSEKPRVVPELDVAEAFVGSEPVSQ